MVTNSTRSGFGADCDSASWFPRSDRRVVFAIILLTAIPPLAAPSVCGMHGMCAVTSPQQALQHDITSVAIGNRHDGLGFEKKVTNSARCSAHMKMTVGS